MAAWAKPLVPAVAALAVVATVGNARPVSGGGPAPAPGLIPSAATAGPTAVRVAPPPRTFSVAATGDMLTERAVLAAAEAAAAGAGAAYDFAALLGPIAPAVRAADLAICHLELPVGRPGQAPANLGPSPGGGNRLLSPYEIVVGVAATGFDRCSTASNHSADLGDDGIDSTLDALDSVGLGHSGTARHAGEAEPAAALFDVNGVRVAHLSYTRFSNNGSASRPWRLNLTMSVQRVVDAVHAARAAGAEVVILSHHLSREMTDEPTADDRRFVTEVTAAAAVELVILHGPHVVHPIERVNGALVYWSIGNLLSGMGVAGTGRYADERTLDGLLASVRFTETSPGNFSAVASPAAVCLDPRTRVVWPGFGPPPEDPAAREVIERCLARSTAVVDGLGSGRTF